MSHANSAAQAPQNETLSHRELINRAGGPAKVAEALEAVLDPPAPSSNTVKAWARCDSVPGPYWQGFHDAKLASLDELAAAADEKRRAGRSEQASQ